MTTTGPERRSRGYDAVTKTDPIEALIAQVGYPARHPEWLPLIRPDDMRPAAIRREETLRTLTSAGVSTRAVRATPAELVDLCQEGYGIVCLGDHAEWLVLSPGRGRIEGWTSGAGHRTVERAQWIRELEQMLGAMGDAIVIVPPAFPEGPRPRSHDGHGHGSSHGHGGSGGGHGGHHEPHHHRHTPPLLMLWQLMRCEAHDIWLVAVFALVVGLLALATPIAVESLVSTISFGRYAQPLIVLALVLLGFLAFSACVRLLQVVLVEVIQRRIFARITSELARRMPRVETESFDREYGPELVNRFFDTMTIQKVASTILLDGIGLVISATIGMAVLAFYHPFLLGYDLLLLVLALGGLYVLGRGAVNTSIDESRVKYRMLAWFEELGRCPTSFSSDGGPAMALQRADQIAFDYLNARQRHFRILFRQIVFALGLQALASTTLLGLGGWLVMQGQLTLGQLVAAELIIAVIMGSLAKFGKHLESFYDISAAMDKVGHLFDLPLAEHHGRDILPGTGPLSAELYDVGYEYPGGRHALHDVSLSIASGVTTAIYGPAGAGKSTLLDLLSHRRRPTSGHILLQGADPRELHPDALRQDVVLVRSGEIISGTVYENVVLGRSHIAPSEVRQVLEAVGLWKTIRDLPEGLDTPLSPSGGPLSSGLADELLLVRAVIGQPRLLLVDCVLDGMSEQTARQWLDYLSSNDQPWTLVLATRQYDLANRCEHFLRVGEGTLARVDLADEV